MKNGCNSRGVISNELLDLGEGGIIHNGSQNVFRWVSFYWLFRNLSWDSVDKILNSPFFVSEGGSEGLNTLIPIKAHVHEIGDFGLEFSVVFGFFFRLLNFGLFTLFFFFRLFFFWNFFFFFSPLFLFLFVLFFHDFGLF